MTRAGVFWYLFHALRLAIIAVTLFAWGARAGLAVIAVAMASDAIQRVERDMFSFRPGEAPTIPPGGPRPERTTAGTTPPPGCEPRAPSPQPARGLGAPPPFS